MIKFFAALAATIALASTGSIARADSSYPESHIQTINDTDKWVWITAYRDYKGGNKGAWCVKPHSIDKHGLRTDIGYVRGEVTGANCSHPVLYDHIVLFSGNTNSFPGVKFSTVALIQFERTVGHPPQQKMFYELQWRSSRPW